MVGAWTLDHSSGTVGERSARADARKQTGRTNAYTPRQEFIQFYVWGLLRSRLWAIWADFAGRQELAIAALEQHISTHAGRLADLLFDSVAA